MPHLRPCSSCSRHVRANEETCPFCAASLPTDTSPPAAPHERLGRAARVALGSAAAVVLTMSGTACGKEPARGDKSHVADNPPYGAPPPMLPMPTAPMPTAPPTVVEVAYAAPDAAAPDAGKKKTPVAPPPPSTNKP
jgi:hypothetical protein